MAEWNCRNTSCNSFGRPHPHCKCASPKMAEGGEVNGFCSETRSHEPSCELFSEPEDHEHVVSGYIAQEGLHGLLKMMGHDPETALDKYQASIKRGHKRLSSDIDNLFEGKSNKEDLEKAKSIINEWTEKEGIRHNIHEELGKQNEFAEGGEVKKKYGITGHPVEHHYPQQNIMLNTIKGRASEYLNGLKPQKYAPKLAFDEEPDQSQKKKAYDSAVKIAANPLRVLDKIKDGSITPDHIKHFNSLHPELNNTLQKKLTEKITSMQLEGKKPSYKVRQGLSLLLGAPLSGELRPANIQAAQAVFQQQGAAPPAAGGNARSSNKSSLSKTAQSYLTADEASASRQQKQ